MDEAYDRVLTMDAATFIPWSMEQEGRHELHGGEVVAMAAERLIHNVVKLEAVLRLRNAARGLPCRAFTDGMAVRIGDRTVYEPDAMLRCGPDLPEETVVLRDPVLVVEVTSPSTSRIDVVAKMAEYFDLPSLRHYLILDIRTRKVLHSTRTGPGADILTRIVPPEGVLRLEPPGIEFRLDAIFEA